MTRNINPNEGGPAGAQLEAKIGAYYLLALLGETEPRGMPGAVAQKVKFQRSYEGHAFDDIIVLGADAAGQPASLEIQAKRTLDFTAGDPKFAKVIAQIVRASEAHAAPVAAAVNLGNRKIERDHHQLLQRARKLSSGADLRRALDASRVMNQGMVAFANTVRDLIAAASEEATDEALWRVLRRLQILVFDFESPGALSVQLVEALCRAVLGPPNAERHGALWDALVIKALSYDADGGEITRPELVAWLAGEKGLAVEPASDLRRARQSFGDASDLALAAIDDSILGVRIDRSARVAAVAEQLDSARFVEIKGRAGAGKSAILKALAEREWIEGRPLVLTPARTPGGGWLTLSNQIGFRGTSAAFLTELAASGCTTLFIDGLDRITDAAAQATIVDLLWGCARTPGMRVAATVGYDFGEEQRAWIPQGLIAALGYGSVRIEALDNAEAAALAAANPRLAQLLLDPAAKDLTRNLYLLRRLVARAGGDLPLTEAALAAAWWEAPAALTPVENRARLMALRVLADQALGGQTVLDLSGLDPAVTQRLVDLDEVDEQFSGSTGVFRHDTVRDWAAANLLREQPGRLDALPLRAVAPVGLARALEIHVRWLVEQAGGEAAWGELWARVREDGVVHGSWRRAVLLSLVRSEQAPVVLDRVLPILQTDDGKLLGALISSTIATDSEPATERFAAAGIAPDRIPADLRAPVGWAWARLMLWLLGRLDDITTPVGREILPFFKQWLVLNGGSDELSLLIVGTLHGWLMSLERQDDEDSAVSFSRLFRYAGRYGADHGHGQEIRTLFLLFCARRPDLADAYLRRRIGERMDDEIADAVLVLGTTIAPAAPAALADFLIDALVTAEQRHAGRFGSRASGRLAFRGHAPMVAGPSSGPFLALLRASKADGLRAIRRIIDYGVGLEEAPGADPPQRFNLELDGRRFAIARPGAYFLVRIPGGDPLLASALRGLEAWGHEQIEAGRPVEDVVMEVLGDPCQAVAAPFLAVALDLMLSHLAAPDPRLIPFMVSPELLKLDFDRFTRDSTGINDLVGLDDDRRSGPPPNADLAARRSRRTCLRWQAPGFLVQGDPAVLATLRQAWEAQRDRLKTAQDGRAGPQSLAWGVEEMLRLTDPANWTEVQVEFEGGRIEPRLSYVEPPEEAAILDSLRERSQADLAETVLLHQLVEAAIDPDKVTSALVDQGMAWTRAQPIADLREDPEDFLLASRWRALVATAVLATRSAGPAGREPWTAKVLRRAAAERGTDHVPTAWRKSGTAGPVWPSWG